MPPNWKDGLDWPAQYMARCLPVLDPREAGVLGPPLDSRDPRRAVLYAGSPIVLVQVGLSTASSVVAIIPTKVSCPRSASVPAPTRYHQFVTRTRMMRRRSARLHTVRKAALIKAKSERTSNIQGKAALLRGSVKVFFDFFPRTEPAADPQAPDGTRIIPALPQLVSPGIQNRPEWRRLSRPPPSAVSFVPQPRLVATYTIPRSHEVHLLFKIHAPRSSRRDRASTAYGRPKNRHQHQPPPKHVPRILLCGSRF